MGVGRGALVAALCVVVAHNALRAARKALVEDGSAADLAAADALAGQACSARRARAFTGLCCPATRRAHCLHARASRVARVQYVLWPSTRR